MRKTTVGNNTGIRWSVTTKLEDSDFADDIALLSSSYQHMQTKVTKMNQFSSKTELEINKKKTEVLRISSKSNNRNQIEDQHLNEAHKYTYLGAMSTNKEEEKKILGTEFVKLWYPS